MGVSCDTGYFRNKDPKRGKKQYTDTAAPLPPTHTHDNI